MPSSNSDNGSLLETPGPGNLNHTPEADHRSPSSPPFFHDRHGSPSTSSLQGEFFLTHDAKRRRRELVLGGVGGTRRKLKFSDSPASLPQQPAAVEIGRFSDDSSDQLGKVTQMLHDDTSANQPFPGSGCLLPRGKRFIDWIRKVDKFITEELRRAKHTRSLNKKLAKRERMIKILMSMR
ncbi:unnamed protein product [Linum tenue]|uniref:Uncharacterized protein n=1 Tax=Linum tenue TaxID=586396 RepID=A0AAV0HS07_9ROSI|nr:unnamed protein product [Linum tenue]